MNQRPDDPVQLLTASNEFEAGLIVDTLQEAGIAARAFAAMTGDAYTSASTGGRVPIMVRRDQMEAAREAIERRRSDSIDIDWSEVDVGQRVEGPSAGGGRFGTIVFGAVVLVIVLTIAWLAATLIGGNP